MIKTVTLLTLLMSHVLCAQKPCEQVLFYGEVQDTLNYQSFYNMMVVNLTKGKGVFGQPNGKFSIYVSPNDSVNISVKGYYLVKTKIIADENCQCKGDFIITKMPVEMEEVVIRPLKTLEQIKEERSNLVMRETRKVTGFEALQSPITALYETFSKKAKNMEWIAQQEYKDDQKRIVKELLRLYVSYDIIKLSEAQFDEFILFLNIDNTFLKTSTEMELITFIQDKFEHFMSMQAPVNGKK
jgi:hypothetical protein